MDVFEAIKGRRSIRSFRPDAIPPDVLDEVLVAARWAPYGTGDDQRQFVALGGQAKANFLDFLAERIDRLLPVLEESASKEVIEYARSLLPVIRTAPVLILVYTELSDAGPLLAISSGAAAVQNLLLAAYERGLGSCWTTGSVYLADEINEYLGIENLSLLALIPLGYPAEEGQARILEGEPIHWYGFEGKVEPLPTPTLALPQPPVEPTDVPRVLVIDDNLQAIAHCTQILEAKGYQVYPLSDPQRVQKVYQQWQPHVVIVDAIMAAKSGHTVVAELREAAAGLLPIIVTTTSYSAADEEHCLAHGADDVIPKPVVGHILAVRVAAHLRARHLYDDLQAANEELRRLEKLRDDLTGMIVHDLRTPLTSILGSLQTIQNADFDPELVAEFIPLCLESGNTLLGMVNDLLDVSKLESGELKLDFSEFELGELVEQVLQGLRSIADDNGLELEGQLPGGEVQIKADRELIRRVVTNLVGNALKFTYQGGVTVRVERSDDGRWGLVHVIDTGEGISEQDRERVFEKFGQAESRQERKKLGTGLGLTFVKMATEAHGGQVSVESELGKGSRFTVSLPVGD